MNDLSRHRPDDGLRNAVRLASLRIRISQSVRALPVVGITLIGLAWFLPGRADMPLFYLSAVLMVSTTIARSIICRYLEPRLENATGQDLDRFEFIMWISLIANTTTTGMSFWLVAAYGDLIVKFLITLIAFFYASGSLVNASSHFPSFAIGIVLNLGQGVLFWCGLSPLSPAQYEVVDREERRSSNLRLM